MRYNFKRYCKDYQNIENYEKALADNFKGWCCHHRLQTWTSEGERRAVDITVEELQALGMYYHRPASELIFLTESEHSSLHQKGKKHFLGKHHSEESKKKNAEAHKGKKMSEEFCRKDSESHKGEKNPFYGKHHTEETRKKMREARKGKCTGKDNPFYGKTHSEEFKKRIGAINKVKMKGMRFFNNGKINIRAKECPEGFVPGRIKKL